MGEKQLTQAEKFKRAARDIDCNDSEDAFDAKLRTIAKQKPKDSTDEKGGKKTPATKKR